MAESLRQLRVQPLQNGFIKPHPPTARMMHSLVQHLGMHGGGCQDLRPVRSGAATLHRGDCAFFSLDGVTILAGNIFFFASSREWGECVFCSAWVRSPVQANASGSWKFDVLNDIVRIPTGNLKCTAAAHIGVNTATVICPPLFLVHS